MFRFLIPVKLTAKKKPVFLKIVLASTSLLLSVLSAGCVSPPSEVFYWGGYEPLLLDMYVKPGKATPETQIIRLESDIQRANVQNRVVGPGIYAHLGYMYILVNKPEKADAAFKMELATFPESKVLIEGMLKRMNKKPEGLQNF